MSIDRKWIKILLPPLTVLGAVLISGVLVALKSEQEREDPIPVRPKIEVRTVTESPDRIRITSQGTVRPRQQTRLTARVSGHIEEVSPDFYEGGFFSKGDTLLRLDSLPYRGALAEAKARLALAEATLIQEREASEQARLDWEAVGTGTNPGPLVLRKPQLLKAESEREAAKVAVEVARENLEYTRIKAPYDGRVDAKFVDVGQAITASVTVLGEIHSSTALEIPVPLSIEELSFVEIPALDSSAIAGKEQKPAALLSKTVNGVEHQWTGILDRTAASVDQQSRMLNAIVRLEPPFTSSRGMNLRPGMFVKVILDGRPLGKVVSVPRSALHPGDTVYRLTQDNRLESRQLEILYTDADTAIISNGLEIGDRVCLTPLLFFVEGMKVEVDQDQSATGEPN